MEFVPATGRIGVGFDVFDSNPVRIGLLLVLNLLNPCSVANRTNLD
jgi:hypothetical protein